MAEDVEIISSESTNHVEDNPDEPRISDRNNVSSTESTSDCIIDVVSTGDVQQGSAVSSISELPEIPTDVHHGQAGCDNNTRPLDRGEKATKAMHPTLRSSSPCSTTSTTDVKTDTGVSASCEIVVVDQGSSKCNSDCDDCDIIVDDSPAASCKPLKQISASKRSKELSCTQQIVRPFTDMQGSVCLSQVRRLSRSTTPSPSFSRFTPSSPSTPRQRSGSLNGTIMASPSPRPSPGERQRAGSLGELDMKDKASVREDKHMQGEDKHGVRIVDNLDILQLPRPRNPGGVLPQNGAENNIGNEALDLIINPRQTTKPTSIALSMATSTFPPFISSEAISSTSALTTSASTSYLISNIMQTTPGKLNKPLVNHVSSLSSTFPQTGAIRGWGSTINESVERPQPSSVVDSEGVAKKIARLEDQNLLSNSVESLWGGRLNTQAPFRNLRPGPDRTPPERPKPPRRGISSPGLDSMDVSGDRFISPSRRRRISPMVHGGSGSGRSTPQNGVKSLKCTLCDYTTYEKVHYRRHRRLHHRNAANSLLRCSKCSFSTSLSRKLRDHYQQVHPHLTSPSDITDYDDNHVYVSNHRYLGARGVGTDTVGPYAGPYYDNTGIDPLLLNRSERLGYPFINPNRQASLNYTVDQYNIPFGDMRNRETDQLASSYLRSMVTSIMNSESNSRQPPSSTVTSSSFYMPSGDTSHQPIHPCNTHDTCRHTGCTVTPTEVKVKVEPDIDAVSDVSSTANSGNTVTPDVITRQGDNQTQSFTDTNRSLRNGNPDSSFEIHRPNRHRSLDSSVLRTMNVANDQPTDLTTPQPGAARACRTFSEMFTCSSDNSSRHDLPSSTNDSSMCSTVVKSDTTTRGVQCVLPLIKSEINLDGDYYDYLGRQRCSLGVDRAVQCNLYSSNSNPSLNSAQRSQNQRLGNRTQSMSESELSEHHSSIGGESRCDHCGIAFDDEVIFSIHIGCHSHTDPFKCNVCGKQCSNKYAFYSHIMRGHQF